MSVGVLGTRIIVSERVGAYLVTTQDKLSISVVTILFHCCYLNCNFTILLFAIFVGPEACGALLLFLLKLGEHGDNGTLLLPHHAPEVVHSIAAWCLGGYECPLLTIALGATGGNKALL